MNLQQERLNVPRSGESSCRSSGRTRREYEKQTFRVGYDAKKGPGKSGAFRQVVSSSSPEHGARIELLVDACLDH
jgi:hypothetical protein